MSVCVSLIVSPVRHPTCVNPVQNGLRVSSRSAGVKNGRHKWSLTLSVSNKTQTQIQFLSGLLTRVSPPPTTAASYTVQHATQCVAPLRHQCNAIWFHGSPDLRESVRVHSASYVCVCLPPVTVSKSVCDCCLCWDTIHCWCCYKVDKNTLNIQLRDGQF